MMTNWLYSCPFIRFALLVAIWIGVFDHYPLEASVTISESEYEERSQFLIETNQATYFFDKAGGGFSRVLDREGNDWVAFSKSPLSEFPASAAAGYRGIPNLLFGKDNPDAGGGHPGFDRCESRKLDDHTIQTNTLNGKWSWEWAFTDEHATLTVTKVDESLPYWFLYEGPVGGKWSPKTHFFGTDLGGPRVDKPDNSKQLYENWRWVYFGDNSNARVLLAAQMEADTIQDTLWYLGNSTAGIDSDNGMVVFGFGRGPKSQPLLRGAGQRFRIGFVDIVETDKSKSTDLHSSIAKTAQTWLTAQEKRTEFEPPLDAQSKQFVASLAESKSPGFHEMPVADARKVFAGLEALFGQGPKDIEVEDRKFAEVSVRIYRPKDAATKVLPAVVYFHGGGWVLGSIETHDALCRRLCGESKAAVISVEYRLAPEHPYPAPLNDCYTALEFASQQASELRLDAKKIVVAGDSAGAGLAAAVAFKARNTSGPKLRAQVLIYPALDSDCNSKTYTSYAEGYGLSKAAMQWYWKQYVGDGPTKVYSSPSKAHSFKDLPETILITAQYDVLREEAELFAQKLKDAGVKVSHRRYDGVLHGFVHFAGAFDQGKAATADIAMQLQKIFASE